MPATIESPQRALRVLIVEDEPRLRDLLLDVVPDMGYPASAVRTAEDAVRVMHDDPHDILILDIQLPMMSGLDLFERVRRDWPTTMVIVLTGYGDLATAQRAIHLDVIEFLSKPCHLREIELALEKARRRATHATAASMFAARDSGDVDDSAGGAMTLAEVERERILAALRRYDGNRTAAAAALGISRRKLHYRLASFRRKGDLID